MNSRLPRYTLLYFGSFNPIHRSHLTLADHALEATGADGLWFVVSPQNPLKASSELAPEEDRAAMVRLALREARHQSRMAACEVEFTMERPSYTLRTLQTLTEQHPDRRFALLIGSDNVPTFNRWRAYEQILAQYPVVVYPRAGYPKGETPWGAQMRWLDRVQLQPYVATQLREQMQSGTLPTGGLLPAVAEYIHTHGLYGISATARTTTPESSSVEQLLEAGRRYHKERLFGDALNAFNQILAIDAEHTEANSYRTLILEILAFRHNDLYNP